MSLRDRKLHHLGAFLEIIAASDDVERTGREEGRRQKRGRTLLLYAEGNRNSGSWKSWALKERVDFKSSCFMLCFCVHASVLGCL